MRTNRKTITHQINDQPRKLSGSTAAGGKRTHFFREFVENDGGRFLRIAQSDVRI